MQETQETQVPSLGWEDPLEKEMATYSSILAWEIPHTEEPSGLQSMALQRVRYDWANEAHTHTHTQGPLFIPGGQIQTFKHILVTDSAACS